MVAQRLSVALGSPTPLLAVVMLGFTPGSDPDETEVVTASYGDTSLNPNATPLVKVVDTHEATLIVTTAPIPTPLAMSFADGIHGKTERTDGIHSSYTFADGGKAERDGYLVMNGQVIELNTSEIGNRANYQLIENDAGISLIARNGDGEGYRFNIDEKVWTRDATIDGPTDALLTLPGENNMAYVLQGSSNGLSINGALVDGINGNVTSIVTNPVNFNQAMVVADNTPYILERSGDRWTVTQPKGQDIGQYAAVLWGRQEFAGIRYNEDTLAAVPFQFEPAEA